MRTSATALAHPYAPIALPVEAKLDVVVRFSAGVARSLAFRELNESEAFTFRDATGAYFRAALRTLDERGGDALVYERMEGSPESPLRITLACAVPSRQRMLLVVQKATELGAVRVLPVLTERSVPREGLEHEKAHAWPGQALRAARQCRRASVPEVRPALALRDALREPCVREGLAVLYLDDAAEEHAKNPLTLVREAREAAGEAGCDVALFVGPEGGFSDGERTLLQREGARALRLGTRVLRAETAALVGLTVLQHAAGDLHP